MTNFEKNGNVIFFETIDFLVKKCSENQWFQEKRNFLFFSKFVTIPGISCSHMTKISEVASYVGLRIHRDERDEGPMIWNPANGSSPRFELRLVYSFF